ncbi:peptidylprolyl isomerase fpr4 [Pleurotus ostreatus]|uniref:Peptidylprolyl isomerase fpr4 n=1 Tax=Pleurotus ostreatus TaxID=5322 RepID=A0A8H6ZQF1_PLEOS|nr:peptidylprolyl isomerase fpr4 [Pleurotus ostreatus]KAF7424847.1 peptidylprolyl isomerase fpr4 [Pleurotus ostreatus]
MYIGLWVLNLKPGAPSTIQPRHFVHVSNAAVDYSGDCADNSAESPKGRTTVKLVAEIMEWDDASKAKAPPGDMVITLGSFSPGQVEHLALDIFLERGKSYQFEAVGCNEISLSGNIIGDAQFNPPSVTRQGIKRRMSPEQDNDTQASTLRKAPKVDTARNVPTPRDIGNVKVVDWKPGYAGPIVEKGLSDGVIGMREAGEREIMVPEDEICGPTSIVFRHE